jgi:hypothetical protein
LVFPIAKVPMIQPAKPGRIASVLLGVGVAFAALAAAGPATARPLAVVELFTSQGCSSCPPANANLIKIKDRPGVLALSYNVTYWDYLGWKDTFGKKEFTDRQVAYEPALGESGPFTPQIVVNGAADTVGNRLSQIDALLTATQAADAPELRFSGDSVEVGTGTPPGGEADIWLVRYRPGVVEVPVARGENRGRTLGHANVVRSLARIGGWSGAAVTLPLPPATEPRLATVVLVQKRNGGPILAAETE